MSGKDNNDEHFENIKFISLTFFVSHFDISGKDDKDLQLKNNSLISVTFSVFHFDISEGKENNDLQFLNIKRISRILLQSHIDIFVIKVNDVQFSNNPFNIIKFSFEFFIIIF